MQEVKNNENTVYIRKKLQEIEDRKWECEQLQRKIESEEDEKEQMLFYAARFNRDMEDDWRMRNMLQGKDYLFEEEAESIQRLRSEYSLTREDKKKAFRKYMNQLSNQEEDYQGELRRLQQSYEESTGE